MARRKPVRTAVDHFMRRLDPTVRSSLSETQLSSIRAAYGEVERDKRHAIEIRGVIPLFLARFYFVFFLGRERRYDKRESLRRGKLAVVWGMLLSLLMLVPLVLFVYALFYLLNLVLGVDFVPDSPPWNILKFW